MKQFKNEVFKRNLQDRVNTFIGISAKDLTDTVLYATASQLDQLENKETQLNKLLEDLFNVFKDRKTSVQDFYSDLGQDLKSTQVIADTKVQRMLENSTEVTKELANILKAISSSSVLVGGCVRDSILNRGAKDIDFATDAHYDNVERILTNNGFKIKEAGKQFLVMIVAKNEEDFEIAMFRKDGNYTDGRRPDSVEIGTIYDDAERRDFTINSLSFNLTTQVVQDPNGTGLQDLTDMVLRFVGKADDRIKEDYLRVARFYRFLGRFKDLGMTADSKSLKACRTNFGAMQKSVAPERLKIEIEKMVGL
jgi:tRNA nucleotidyltransferase/poly(A) polymerase